MSLVIFSYLFIGGCTTTYLEMQSWEGRSLNDLYFEWGKPDVIENTKKGRVYTWVYKRNDDGKVKTCRKSFYTQDDGHGEVIVDTKYSGCHFLTLK